MAKITQACKLEIPMADVIALLRAKGWPIPPEKPYSHAYEMELKQNVCEYDYRHGNRGSLVFEWESEVAVTLPTEEVKP